MIVKPENMTFSDKTFTMIIYGAPGIGKTTLALSAPKPILIDFDKGVARVKAYHRKTTIVCASYYDVLKDIEDPAIKDAETVIIDTGGSFVTYLQAWAIHENPRMNRQANGALSLKGYGAVKQEFLRFSNYIRDVLHKNLIYVFHSQEGADKDGNTVQRLLCEGATKNIVWQPCDLGGFVQMIGDRRVIGFTPTQEYFAKGCYGIDGVRDVPTLTGPDTENTFLTELFNEARATIAAENEFYAPQREQYNMVMIEAKTLIDGIETPDQATEAGAQIKSMPHALTSLAEIRAMFKSKIAALGFVWDKETGAYKAAPEA